jgi:cyclophilin family peptidyl-prolyl cis-trans isomerase
MKMRVCLVSIMIIVTAAGVAGAAPVQLAARTPEEICTEATANIQEPAVRTFAQAEQVLKDGVDYWAVFCTEKGPIYVDLLEDDAPITVNSFVFLAQQGYYNNTTFHRVLPGFMAQGGDPTGTGAGDPGYSFVNETKKELVFDRPGLLAMANAGPDTNGSQFFITVVPADYLNGSYTIFGQVFQGQDVVELIRLRDPEQQPDYPGDTLQTIVIVEDPATVAAVVDGIPTLDHFQALLAQQVVSQVSDQYALDADFSHTYDLTQEAESWTDEGGAAFVDFMKGYLQEHGFQGTAAALLLQNQCPATPQEGPIWAVGFQVSDYGTADQAQAVLTDNTLADQFVQAGVFQKYADELDGRLFSIPTPADQWCGPNGVYYRYQMTQGRYLLTVDTVVDSSILSDQTSPTVLEFMDYLMNGLLVPPVAGSVERGNTAS